MNVKELKTRCRTFPAATETQQSAPSNVLVYAVGGKTFAYFKTSEPEKWRFSIKVSPDRFLELTGIPGVKPARYMARFHWVTIVDVNAFPESYLTELLECSYRKALEALSKAARRAIGEADAGLTYPGSNSPSA